MAWIRLPGISKGAILRAPISTHHPPWPIPRSVWDLTTRSFMLWMPALAPSNGSTTQVRAFLLPLRWSRAPSMQGRRAPNFIPSMPSPAPAYGVSTGPMKSDPLRLWSMGWCMSAPAMDYMPSALTQRECLGASSPVLTRPAWSPGWGLKPRIWWTLVRWAGRLRADATSPSRNLEFSTPDRVAPPLPGGNSLILWEMPKEKGPGSLEGPRPTPA